AHTEHIEQYYNTGVGHSVPMTNYHPTDQHNTYSISLHSELQTRISLTLTAETKT
ncbi:hypothetical protein Bpfe_026698, partial [Biomphalaria pfeifferi]